MGMTPTELDRIEQIPLKRASFECNIQGRLTLLERRFEDFKSQLKLLPPERQSALLEQRNVLDLRLRHVRKLFAQSKAMDDGKWLRDSTQVEAALINAEQAFRVLR